VISVDSLDDAIAIMSALNSIHQNARADRMQKGYLVRGKKDEEKDYGSRPDTGGHGADPDGRKSSIVAGGAGNADVLLR